MLGFIVAILFVVLGYSIWVGFAMMATNKELRPALAVYFKNPADVDHCITLFSSEIALAWARHYPAEEIAKAIHAGVSEAECIAGRTDHGHAAVQSINRIAKKHIREALRLPPLEEAQSIHGRAARSNDYISAMSQNGTEGPPDQKTSPSKLPHVHEPPQQTLPNEVLGEFVAICETQADVDRLIEAFSSEISLAADHGMPAKQVLNAVVFYTVMADKLANRIVQQPTTEVRNRTARGLMRRGLGFPPLPNEK